VQFAPVANAHPEASAHVVKTIAAKPRFARISIDYSQQQEEGATLPHNKYVEVWPEKPGIKEQITRSSERASTVHIS
jgi:hypothetical protein